MQFSLAVVHHRIKLRKLKNDIIEEVKLRFPLGNNKAIEVIANYQEKYDYLDSDRIIRYVIFLADGMLKSLESNFENAKIDPPDVMLWAEYENTNDLNPKRVRDFNKPFIANKL